MQSMSAASQWKSWSARLAKEGRREGVQAADSSRVLASAMEFGIEFIFLIVLLSFSLGFVFSDVRRRIFFRKGLARGLAVVRFGPSSTQEGRGPKDVNKRCSELVWELHCPHEEPDVEIVFFPGLHVDGNVGDAFWKTWVAKDNDNVVWPKEWLSLVLPSARILCGLCESGADEEPDDVFRLAEQLVNELILNPGVLDFRCPVIFVGQSLGGLIIKHLFVSAAKLLKELPNCTEADCFSAFLENCKGVYYYSTPHLGSRLANLSLSLLPDSLENLVATIISEAPRVGESFRRICRVHDVRSFAMVEGRETYFTKPSRCWSSSVRVVDPKSAQSGADDWFVHTTRDHFTVCRAESPNDPVISELCRFVVEVLTLDKGASESARRPCHWGVNEGGYDEECTFNE